MTAASAGVPGRVADGARGEQAPRDEERPADLLVGRDRDTREPARRRELGGGEEQARLADARLALEGHRGEATRRFLQLLGDGVQLGAPPDDGTGRPTELDSEGALGPDEGVERTTVGHAPGPVLCNGGHLAHHAAEYDAWPHIGPKATIVTAAVKDVEAWLKFKAEMTAALSAVASDGSSYVAMDGSSQVASTWDVPDIEAFQAAQRSFAPELAAAAEQAGMIPPVMIYIKK